MIRFTEIYTGLFDGDKQFNSLSVYGVWQFTECVWYMAIY